MAWYTWYPTKEEAEAKAATLLRGMVTQGAGGWWAYSRPEIP